MRQPPRYIRIYRQQMLCLYVKDIPILECSLNKITETNEFGASSNIKTKKNDFDIFVDIMLNTNIDIAMLNFFRWN